MPARAELQQHVHVLPVLVCLIQLDDEVTVDHREDVSLQRDLLLRLRLDDVALGQALQGEFFAAGGSGQEDRAEAALAQEPDHLQIGERDVRRVAMRLIVLHVLLKVFAVDAAVGTRHELPEDVRMDHEHGEAVGPCLHSRLRRRQAQEQAALAEATRSPEPGDLAQSLLPVSVGKLLLHDSASGLDDVQVVVFFLRRALPDHHLTGLKLEQGAGAPHDGPPFGADQGAQQVHIVEQLDVLLKIRTFSCKGLLESSSAHHVDLGGFERAHGGDEPRVV
mmetsp:Transcript_94859/g.274297  ORF Transcript_94859/g.274297 Transcript_94859/m.274297 type:complete len:278 (+) Transcript_94859:852-1685(+)